MKRPFQCSLSVACHQPSLLLMYQSTIRSQSPTRCAPHARHPPTQPPTHARPNPPCTQAPSLADQVLQQLRRIIDPDFGEDIVSCGFVKELDIDPQAGSVSFTLELTTPACPVKDQFKREAQQYVQVRAQLCVQWQGPVPPCSGAREGGGHHAPP